MTKPNKITQIDPNEVSYIQSRAEMNLTLIDEYAAMMANGIEFDPVEGFQDSNNQIFIWDGAHRTEAARKVNQLLAVRLTPGSRSEAEWLALSANQKHGLRRSRADKQRVVQQALSHSKGVHLSNREIARHCGVDHKTVGRVRSEMEVSGEIPQITERTVTRNGTSYQFETTKPDRTVIPVPKDNKGNNYDDQPAANTDIPEILPNAGQQQTATETVVAEKPNDEATQPATTGHHYILEEDQPHACPRCGEQRVRGVNGSQRWCINCGANWPTAATFLNDVATVNGRQPDRLRAELGFRFTNLLGRLSPAQLVQLERDLSEIEQRLTVLATQPFLVTEVKQNGYPQI